MKLRSLMFVPLVGLTLALGACGNAADADAGAFRTHELPKESPQATYVTRAQIVALPEPGPKGATLRAHHEAVDNFMNREGKVVGMGAMVMDFPPVKGLSLDGFKKGDKVEMTWSVWWTTTPAWLCVKLTKLPDDTKLEFRPANPPGQTPPAR